MQTVKDPEVLNVLKQMTFKDNVAYLPPGQLESKLYKKVDAVLKACQGKWNTGKKGHVFPSDAESLLKSVMEDGEYHDLKRDDNLFETPPALIERLEELAMPGPGMLALEPSAGRGRIVETLLRRGAAVYAYELNEQHRQPLRDIQSRFSGGDTAFDFRFEDFLTVEPTVLYDLVVMNPPFARGSDVKHILHAWKFLKPGGHLVAIASSRFTARSDSRSNELFDLVKLHGQWFINPPNSFKSEGTNVHTVTILLNKEAT